MLLCSVDHVNKLKYIMHKLEKVQHNVKIKKAGKCFDVSLRLLHYYV